MLLTSFSFLLFFTVVFLLHYLVFGKSLRAQNGFVLLASCTFYAMWDWRFLGLLLATALSTFYTGKAASKLDGQRRTALNVGCIVLNIGILFAFKYYNFFAESFVDLARLVGVELSVPTLKWVLPVGISFYTFSALSYVIDVWRKQVNPTENLLAYLCYVAFFPSILSGPINRATKQLPQFLQLRRFEYQNVVEGSKMLVWGLFVKLCVADRLGIYVDTVYANMLQHTGLTLLVTSFIYTIQIYADFSGYSLMAIGLGRMLGIELQTNFLRPYFATTVTDFWRRWHISLTTWFRDYIYFPLGGNRCSHMRWMFNTMVVFVISGLWHGAAYTFLIWGAFHGLCMIVEKQIYGTRLKSMDRGFSIPNALRMCVTFLIVNFAWIAFRLNSIGDLCYCMNRICCIGGG